MGGNGFIWSDGSGMIHRSRGLRKGRAEMNPAKSEPLDYINFLVAAQKSFTCSEAARCQPETPEAPAHGAFTRLLRRQPPDTGALWQETQGPVQREAGVLILDGTTLDKPHARKMELVARHRRTASPGGVRHQSAHPAPV